MTHQTPRSDAKGQCVRDRPFHVRDWDYLGWRYSVISSIGTAPLNHVVDLLPARDETEFAHFRPEDQRWLRRWMDWTDANRPTLRNLRPILGPPVLGRVDGTAAIAGDRGFLFLFNPNYRELSAEFALDAGIGLARGDAFLLRELYPREGCLLGTAPTGTWRYGDKVSLAIKGPAARVVEIVPAAAVNRPAVLNAPGTAALEGDRLALRGVEGEAGKAVELIVLLPPNRTLAKVTVNGRDVASFVRQNDVVAVPVTFAGARFDHCQQVGSYDRNFSDKVFRAHFTVPQRVFKQLADRRKAWPVPYTDEELLATWRASHRLLLYVHLADPDDKGTVGLKLNGKPVEVKKAYSDVFPLGRERTFTGFYADVSGLKPDTRYEAEVTLPDNLLPGQFQGLFFENVEAEFTTEISGSSSRPAAAVPQHGMVLVAAGRWPVGTSDRERAEVGRRFDCHPTWLGDDLRSRDVDLPAFWIDRFPVSNAQYLAFVEATGHARPDWWGRWGGVFPTGYADHPVVGVSGQDAAAYARWAGKRLPTAPQWEAAVGGASRRLFAWGDQWPGPLKLHRADRIYWELPATRPLGTGGCGRAACGVEDFAGQVVEWVADVVPHHGVQFQAMKGASWFHEDPVNFRTASAWYAYEGWRSAFTGFRCAMDAGGSPRPVPQSRPRQSVSAEAAARELRKTEPQGPIALNASGGTSRHLSIHAPRLGRESVGLSAPETIVWNGAGVMTWQKTPDMTWTERSPRRAAYQMRFDALRVDAEFLAEEAMVRQQFTAVNLTDKPGSFRTSSCFNLQGHPRFYDCEQLRTYALDDKGEFVPVRRLSRGGDCVRWITGPGAGELGQARPWTLLAVVARDGRGVIATGRAGAGSGFSVATNTLFTCLHADSSIEVPPRGQATTRQVFWFLEGKLDDLGKRWRRDLGLDR